MALGSCFHTARELGICLGASCQPFFVFHSSFSLPASFLWVFLSFPLQCLSFRPFSLRAIDWWADLTGDVAVRGLPMEVLTRQWGRVEGPQAGRPEGCQLSAVGLFSWHHPQCAWAGLREAAHIPRLSCDCWVSSLGRCPEPPTNSSFVF